MGRVLALFAVVVALIAGAAFLPLACAPFQDAAPQDSPGVELDIDMPKKHKKAPTYKAPAPKPPKIGKR